MVGINYEGVLMWDIPSWVFPFLFGWKQHRGSGFCLIWESLWQSLRYSYVGRRVIFAFTLVYQTLYKIQSSQGTLILLTLVLLPRHLKHLVCTLLLRSTIDNRVTGVVHRLQAQASGH
jgi:hypothetical protein